jgi:ABC-type lipoprotein release transport system permease subunit
MNLIIKIAWRNILRHKGKSLIVGMILFLGALIMTVGNGVISGMDNGLRNNIVNCFTGDMVIISDKQQSDNVFFEMMGKPIEPINNVIAIKKVLDRQPYIAHYLPVGKNAAMVLNEDGGTPGTALLIGVDFDKYRAAFPNNVTVLEGRLPKSGERGALIASGARKDFYTYTNIWFIADNDTLHTANLSPEAMENKNSLSTKNNLVLLGLNDDNSTADIRLGVKGVIKYRALNHVWGHFVLIDIESYRQCLGYFSAFEKNTEIAPEQKKLMSMDNDNLDAMFGSNELVVADSKKTAVPEKLTPAVPKADTLARTGDIDAGAYNMVLTFTKPGVKLDEGIKKLNTALQADSLGVHAVSWKKAVGALGSMAVLIKGALFVFVMFLFFVAIIIIVNTLSMAALERTSEIGMMRAVGARKSFISRMFAAETALLSFVFGGLGIVCGTIAVNILTLCHIHSDNDMVQLLFGGDTFAPFLSGGDIIVVIVQLTLVTLVAVVYPIRVARSITPLDAISRE